MDNLFWVEMLDNLRRTDTNFYRRPHKRGLEQNCLPLVLTTAITPAANPAQSTEDMNWCVFRPAEKQT